MQRIENSAWHTRICTSGNTVRRRGNMLTRDLKIKIYHEKYLMEYANELLKETYLETMRENMGEWSRTVREYRRTLEISQ